MSRDSFRLYVLVGLLLDLREQRRRHRRDRGRGDRRAARQDRQEIRAMEARLDRMLTEWTREGEGVPRV